MRQASETSPQEVEAAFQRVLARQEGERRSLLAEFFDWFGESFGFEGAGVAGRVVLIAIGVLVAALLVRFLYRLSRYGWTGAGGYGLDDADAGPTIEERVARLRAEAREARAKGETRLALRKLLFALVLGLGRRGDLEFRPAWTYRELLARGNPTPAVDRLLAPLVTELEAKEFGRVPVVDADLDRLEQLCRRYLGAAA